MFKTQTFKLGLWLGLCTFLMLPSLAFGQGRSVSGTVSSAEDKRPLAGTTVRVKGTLQGTAADAQGRYRITVAGANPVLVFSFVGMASQEVAVGSQAVVDVALATDRSQLNEVVSTASRDAVRKIETTTAIDVLTAKELEIRTPVSIADALKFVPGVYTSSDAGRFGGTVFIRGFPDGSGNGLDYTGFLLDGLPTFGTPGRPVDEVFKLDDNVERVEVVRGSAATLFGRASAAGVVNIFTRTGGEQHHGSVKISSLSNTFDTASNPGGLNPRIDLNFHGPLNEDKTLRYQIGGFQFRDNGYRNAGFPDFGGQYRANIDYLNQDGGSVRLYGSFADMTVQNLVDIPYEVDTNTIRAGWHNYNTFVSPSSNQRNYTVLNGDGSSRFLNVGQALSTGNFLRGGMIGMNINQYFDKLKVVNLMRFQNYDVGTKYNLGIGPFVGATMIRSIINGEGPQSDFANEFRLEYPAITGNIIHRMSAGVYYSRVTLGTETFGYSHNATTADPNNIVISGFVPPAFAIPATGSILRRADYDMRTTAFFFGNEMKMDKLTINVGLRHDSEDMDLADKMVRVGCPSGSTVAGCVAAAPILVQRDVNHADYSASLGFNYMVQKDLGVYGNIVRAYRPPNYAAYTPVRYNYNVTPGTNEVYSQNPNGIDKNEIILNTELGARGGFGDFNFDASVYRTHIANRLATVYEGTTAVAKPLGTNQILGAEGAFGWNPADIKGLSVKTTFTVQKGTFEEFAMPITSDVNGATAGGTFNPLHSSCTAAGTNAVSGLPNYTCYGITIEQPAAGRYQMNLKGKLLPRFPSAIVNLRVGYDAKNFGVDVAGSYIGTRYMDPANILQLAAQNDLDGNVYVKLPMENGQALKFTVSGRNLLNTNDQLARLIYVGESDAAFVRRQYLDNSALTQAEKDVVKYATGIPSLPRRLTFTMQYTF